MSTNDSLGHSWLCLVFFVSRRKVEYNLENARQSITGSQSMHSCIAQIVLSLAPIYYHASVQYILLNDRWVKIVNVFTE